MPELNISIPHRLTQAEAAQRISSLLNDLKAEHGDKITNLQEEWDNHTGKFACSVMGFRVSGILAITNQKSSTSLRDEKLFGFPFDSP